MDGVGPDPPFHQTRDAPTGEWSELRTSVCVTLSCTILQGRQHGSEKFWNGCDVWTVCGLFWNSCDTLSWCTNPEMRWSAIDRIRLPPGLLTVDVDLRVTVATEDRSVVFGENKKKKTKRTKQKQNKNKKEDHKGPKIVKRLEQIT